MKAVWNNKVIAESDKTINVDGVHYFPPDSVKMEFLKLTKERYTCGVKLGTCDYYDVTAEGKTSKNGAWVYHKLDNPDFKNIEHYFAFWQGVEVKE